MSAEIKNKDIPRKTSRKVLNLRNLGISLKHRPDIYRLILKLHRRLCKKNNTILKLKKYLEKLRRKVSSYKNKPLSRISSDERTDETSNDPNNTAWNDVNTKSITEQVTEAAQTTLDQTGMVYVESAGMYYDYKTGYYYNSDLGLYYHTSTGCYYTYDKQLRTFVFHSYPDTSKVSKEQKALNNYMKMLAKKHKKDNEENEQTHSKSKKIKISTKKKKKDVNKEQDDKKEIVDSAKDDNSMAVDISESEKDDATNQKVALEDGECSESSLSSDGEYGATTASEEEDDDDDFVSKHHPPCMRIIVKETNISKLKVGSLFLITKDGGTIGREGDHHSFVLKDLNVSKNHLGFEYDMLKKSYVATDLGSRNGTILNGHRMSESQEVSPVMVIPHGSILQLGETKLLCHIHSGNDTCGHCEPGLIMEAESKEKQTAYSRTCNVKKQHELELARLKNKYAPQPLAIEETAYNDRAKVRRETIGSSHYSEKTQQSDLDTELNADNKGFKLLQKMGWSKGEGLGKNNQGETAPIPLVNNESKAGLGAIGAASTISIPIAGRVPLRLTTKNRPLRPPAKAFRDPLEEDD